MRAGKFTAALRENVERPMGQGMNL